MSAPYLYLNGAESTVASYNLGAGTVNLATGTGARFGNPSPSTPLLFTVAPVGTRLATGLYKCTSRDGDQLKGVTAVLGGSTISGDYRIDGSPWTAQDATAIWEAIDAIQTGSGSVWRNGSGAPSNSLGANGDYYLDVSNGDVYFKASGSYTVIANLKGPQGNTGATGPAGSPGSTGATGATGAAGTPGSVWRNGSGAPSDGLGANGDYYLRDDNGAVYLKASGTYSVVANIKGPSGEGGAAGRTLYWRLGVNVDVVAGATAGITVTSSGTWGKLKIVPHVNGASGGFTLDVRKGVGGGTTILEAPIEVPAASTTVVNETTFNVTAFAEDDVIKLVLSDVGVAVQDVEVFLIPA